MNTFGQKWTKILLDQWIFLDKSEQKYFWPSEYFWRIHRSGKLFDQQFSFACLLATAARNQFVGGAGRCLNSPKVERTLHQHRNPNIKQWQTISLNSPKLELALDRKGNHNIITREIICLGDYSWALQKNSRRLQSNVKSLYPEPGIDLFCRDWGAQQLIIWTPQTNAAGAAGLCLSSPKWSVLYFVYELSQVFELFQLFWILCFCSWS